MAGMEAPCRTAPFSATRETALREASLPCRADTQSKPDSVHSPDTILARYLINRGMRDSLIHQMKSEWERGCDDRSLHQPANDGYGAIEFGKRPARFGRIDPLQRYVNVYPLPL